MKISELTAALQQAQVQHGDLDVLVLNEELGEWCETRSATVEGAVTVWRDGVPMIEAVLITADYDG